MCENKTAELWLCNQGWRHHTSEADTVAENMQFDDVSPSVHYAIGVYLSLLGMFAVTGNSLVLIVMHCAPVFKKKSQNWLIKAVALSDLGLSLLAYPPTAISSFFQGWIFGDQMCKVYGFIAFSLAMISMNALVLVAVLRFIVVCKPEHESRLTTPFIRNCFVISSLYSVGWTALPLVGWNSYTYEAFGTACSINWLGETFSDRSYVIATMFTCYAFQLCTVVYCYIRIICTTKQLNFGYTGKNKPEKKYVMMRIEDIAFMRKVETERTVTMLCFVMILTFIVLWTPYAVISLISMFVKPHLLVTILPTMFAKLSCAANPVIYVMLSGRFRRSFAQLRLRRRGQQHVRPVRIEFPGKYANTRKLLHPIGIDYLTKDGIYVGRNAVFYSAEPSLF